MPSYYNPALFPVTYSGGYSPNPQVQNYGMAPQIKTMEWVEGEVGAKAFQMPAGVQPNQWIPLWDNKDKIIWLKSWNQFGMPNPIQKLTYEIDQEPQIMLPEGQSHSEAPDTSKYVTKEDLDSIIKEMRSLFAQNNQNGRSNRGEQNAKPSV